MLIWVSIIYVLNEALDAYKAPTRLYSYDILGLTVSSPGHVISCVVLYLFSFVVWFINEAGIFLIFTVLYLVMSGSFVT